MRKIENALITGPTGAIGMALIDELLSQGINVCCVINPDSKRAENIKEREGVSLVKCDIAELKSLPDLIKKENENGKAVSENYDVFYHFAWLNTFGQGRNDVDSQIKNIKYTIAAVETAAELSCKLFIGAGSQAEYGRSNKALRSDTATFPENGYGIAKLAAGQLSRIRALQLGMEHIWTRILSVYGPYDGEKTLVQTMIKKLKAGESPDTTEGEQIWDFLYSKDAARAFYLIASKGISEKTYVIGSGEGRPLRTYIEEIRDQINSEVSINFGAIPYTPKQVMFLKADIEELKADTGFAPETDFKEGIRSMLS